MAHNSCPEGKWLSLPEAGATRASDIKKEASDAFRDTVGRSSKQAHSGQGDKKLKAQAKALEDFIKKNEKEKIFVPEYMEPIEREAKRLRNRANADRHK